MFQTGTNTGLTLLYNGTGELARTRKVTYAACTQNEILLAKEYFTFGPDGRALSLVSENQGRVESEYVWLDDLPVAQLMDSYDSAGTLQGTTVTYLHTDHLGTPRLGTDENKAVTWRWQATDAFGTGSATGSAVVRLRMPGQVNLGLGGVVYNYYRDYYPTWGRYLESDPTGIDGGLNTYGYALANPTRYSDPDGLAVRLICRDVDLPGRAKHCFVYVSCPSEGWSRVLSLFATDELNSRGYKYGYDPRDRVSAATQPDFRRDNPLSLTNTFNSKVSPPACYEDRCGYERQVLGRFQSFGGYLPNYNGALGPNSNTFARFLLGPVALPPSAPVDNVVTGAPGIGDPVTPFLP